MHVVRVEFLDGAPADYVTPIVDGSYEGAAGSPAFLAELARLVCGETSWSDAITRIELRESRAKLSALRGQTLDVEQSNTSIRYGDDWVVKLSRRLSYGPSPELELSTVMNRWEGPRCAPRIAASLELRTDVGVAPLAAQAEFIANQGDGWSYLLGLLRAESASGERPDDAASSMREVEAIAELTADMHGALSLDPWHAHVAPERITPEIAAGWEARLTSSLEHGLGLLRDARSMLLGRSGALAELVVGASPVIRAHTDGFRALVGSTRIRVHGDYHLGQVLRTHQGRYVAIDFDGEPQRSLKERRAKFSPLRDVAGMLGSFSYAIGTVQAEQGGSAKDAWFPMWERTARRVFVAAYVGRLTTNGSTLLPADLEQVRQSLAALELEKAVYMIHYELNNRPDWVWIPLSQLVKMS